MNNKSRVIDIIDEFIEHHTEDYLDWKYSKEIYEAQQRILGSLKKFVFDKLKDSDINE